MRAPVATRSQVAAPLPPDQEPASEPRRVPVWTALAVATSLAVLAASVIVGADTMWLVALGDVVLRTGSVPVGLPFAVVDTTAWPPVPALGGVLLALVDHLGPLGLPAVELAAAVALLSLLAVAARRLGATDGATAAAVFLVALGTFPALMVVRAQLLSLVPFAVLLLILRGESRRPSTRVWWLVPLVAVWGNLHGTVLLGVAVGGCYLLVGRLRRDPWTAAGVLASMLVALLLNPAGLRTPAYYYGVFTNETARQHILLWAPLQLSAPFDLLLVVTTLLLLGLALFSRRPVWEYVAAAGLLVSAASAARNGIWLSMFAVAPAAAGLTALLGRRTRSRPAGLLRAVALVCTVAMVCLSAALLVQREPAFAADADDARAIARLAAGRTVLAPEPLAEALAADGSRVWIADPLDAFPAADQDAYLAFLAGHGRPADRALDAAVVVVVVDGSPAAALARRDGFVPMARVGADDIDVRSH